MARRSLFPKLLTLGVYALATLQFIRYYVVSTTFYLDPRRYLSGRERLPFQERILPIFLMWPINHSGFLMRHFSHPNRGWDAASASSPDQFAFYVIALCSFSVAGLLVVLLYGAVHPEGRLRVLVFPMFMVLTMWAYMVHIDANFSYPYDMPSLAFFAGGLLAIYTRKFLPLLLIVLIGTANRETTLFLVGIYVLDAASRDISPRTVRAIRFMERFSFRQVPWPRVALLLAIWMAVKLTIHMHFSHNDRSEDFVRIRENLGRLTPRLWPVLFNICGYVLPVVIVLRSRLFPVRFANYLYIFPLWLAVMFYSGVILESRIFGELCTYTAVASVLLIEQHLIGARAAAHEDDGLLMAEVPALEDSSVGSSRGGFAA